jgi:hypothetical protein
VIFFLQEVEILLQPSGKTTWCDKLQFHVHIFFSVLWTILEQSQLLPFLIMDQALFHVRQ